MGISLDVCESFFGNKVTTTSVPPDSRRRTRQSPRNFAHGRALLSCRSDCCGWHFRHAAAVILDGQFDLIIVLRHVTTTSLACECLRALLNASREFATSGLPDAKAPDEAAIDNQLHREAKFGAVLFATRLQRRRNPGSVSCKRNVVSNSRNCARMHSVRYGSDLTVRGCFLARIALHL